MIRDEVYPFLVLCSNADANGNSILESATCNNAISANDVMATGEWVPIDYYNFNELVGSYN